MLPLFIEIIVIYYIFNLHTTKYLNNKSHKFMIVVCKFLLTLKI
uniref:Uncharacterized protein n=1 Tax=Podoviridae sp. ctQyH19 TaxID=2825249 RepID=A0A8S5UQT4_9CAUD|nr:MAG TPA: hypothetical protein [Podoviridae sp. ctQyH19]